MAVALFLLFVPAQHEAQEWKVQPWGVSNLADTREVLLI
jgi:hypothetical protein|tara:strand:- start:248 stop:364 length:117 start_codon:yes stop_codon:yes gene_type:complete